MAKRNRANVSHRGKKRFIGPFKPLPGTEIPLEVFTNQEARWILRIFCVFIFLLIVGIIRTLFILPDIDRSIWGMISKALETFF